MFPEISMIRIIDRTVYPKYPTFFRPTNLNHIPLNDASKSHHLSIGGHPDDRLVLSEEAAPLN